MPLITTAVPNLIGGVSQQPPAIRNANEAEAIDNAIPSPIEGLTKRPPTEHIAAVADSSGNLRYVNLTAPPFIHMIERDETEKYILCVQENGTADIYALDGTRKTLYTQAGVSLGNATKAQRKALTIGDITFLLNTTTVVAATNDTVSQTPANYNRNCLVWLRQANYEREHIIKLTSGATTTTASHKPTGNTDVGTNHAALNLADTINNTNTYSATIAVDSTIHIIGSADFTVVLEDDFAGEGMTMIRNEVERFEDLPPTAPHNYMVKVLGSVESQFDDYWVKFRADNGNFSRGVWEETAAPGLKYKFDSATLPLILIRQSDGSFFLKKADGTTPTTGDGRPAGTSATAYNIYAWGERLVGDDTTNPFGSFLGYTISDMVFHQNRLAFLSGENIVFSEVSEFFNFWRTTTLDLLDTDIIDIASSSPRVGKILAAVPFNRDLILFTPTGQLVVRGGEVLSPKSVAIISAADFDNQANVVEPIPSANSVFFTFSNGNYTGLRELVPQPALDGSYFANDLTNNVSKYIPGPPSHLTATTHDNIAAVVSDGNIYCYRYFVQNNERIQSAWFRFLFPDSNANSFAFAKAIWAGFLDSDMYVVMLRTRTSTTAFITIEKIRMGVASNDTATTGKSWLTHLDQRKYFAAGQGSYNSTTGLTTFTLPKPMSYAAGKTAVVTADGYQASISSGTTFSDPTAATVSVVGDYSAKAVWIGTLYTMTFEFGTPYLRAPVSKGMAALLTGRYQLRYLTIQYADTAYFKVTVGIKNESSYEYYFTGEILGAAVIGNTNISSGTFRAPVHSKNTNIVVKIINDSPLPSKLLSCEFEAFYNDRATRFG